MAPPPVVGNCLSSKRIMVLSRKIMKNLVLGALLQKQVEERRFDMLLSSPR